MSNSLLSISKALAGKPIDESSLFDPDQFLFDKKSALDHFFNKVHEELAREKTFAMHFYLSYSKQLAKEGTCDEQSLDILRKCLKKITMEDIEVFLYFEPDIAL